MNAMGTKEAQPGAVSGMTRMKTTTRTNTSEMSIPKAANRPDRLAAVGSGTTFAVRVTRPE